MTNPCGCNWNLGMTCLLHTLEWRAESAKKDGRKLSPEMERELLVERRTFADARARGLV